MEPHTTPRFDYESRLGRMGLDEEIEKLIPYWPLWYESKTSAVTERLRDREGPIDPAESRYHWDVSSWSFASADE